MQTETMNASKEAVLSFLKALNEEDFETARTYVDDNMSFNGVLGSRDNADAYFKDMKHMKFKYEIQKIFAEEDDVCVLYDIDMGSGKKIFTCGWYKLNYGK